jgi:hypothetical protein
MARAAFRGVFPDSAVRAVGGMAQIMAAAIPAARGPSPL